MVTIFSNPLSTSHSTGNILEQCPWSRHQFLRRFSVSSVSPEIEARSQTVEQITVTEALSADIECPPETQNVPDAPLWGQDNFAESCLLLSPKAQKSPPTTVLRRLAFMDTTNTHFPVRFVPHVLDEIVVESIPLSPIARSAPPRYELHHSSPSVDEMDASPWDNEEIVTLPSWSPSAICAREGSFGGCDLTASFEKYDFLFIQPASPSLGEVDAFSAAALLNTSPTRVRSPLIA
mmetsp:Transcript_3828/g.7711  ORF Transcript_3828/g.7711 Transcript_3828/m.7711 type:complete len:235 (+) Transcript_3828:132-836(+)|eukprot:CAMPEP_0181303990 /NCGR_PEP_ID=MMETSP1101-20121128/8882_1 /TAXON_ID=46948 /ORGANISM="Rhodomonas abbreviata, Strain Caron Lab Isolate" /LENGTH=234 /DNA_ID=CAMNT_0023409659 /DNA_START=113 /DNA_END=817 /DNA_ORIENTATION=+